MISVLSKILSLSAPLEDIDTTERNAFPVFTVNEAE